MNISKTTLRLAVDALEKMAKEVAWGKKIYELGGRSAYDILCAKRYDSLVIAITELKGKLKNAKKT